MMIELHIDYIKNVNYALLHNHSEALYEAIADALGLAIHLPAKKK